MDKNEHTYISYMIQILYALLYKLELLTYKDISPFFVGMPNKFTLKVVVYN